jgi:diaminohydroxyphosphoribosylaminopyrimidine deaminase/5-amino-6-(5-phosphoribosylamino)uracil reductase
MLRSRAVSRMDPPSASPFPRPFVTVSYAQTLDGRLATVTGSSQWISGPESLHFTHELRAGHDAVMVGVGTVCRDNPRLTVRLVPGSDPLRVVVDSTLRTPSSAAVLSTDEAPGTLFAVTERAPDQRRGHAKSRGASVVPIGSTEDGRVNLRELLCELYERGIRSVMVEGGARLITSFLRERLVDRLAVCVAFKVLGSGLDAVGDLGIKDIGLAFTLEETTVTRHEGDVLIDGRVTYPNDA